MQNIVDIMKNNLIVFFNLEIEELREKVKPYCLSLLIIRIFFRRIKYELLTILHFFYIKFHSLWHLLHSFKLIWNSHGIIKK